MRSLETCMGDRVHEVRAATLRSYRAMMADADAMATILARRYVCAFVAR